MSQQDDWQEMTKSWVEAVGGEVVVAPLAEECGVELDERQRRFLERFGALVEAAVQGSSFGLSQTSRAVGELRDVRRIVQDEVDDALSAISAPCKELVESAKVVESPETGLPVTTIRLRSVGDLVILVCRSYYNVRAGVSYGFRSDVKGKHPSKSACTGAVNRLDEVCRQKGWQVSVRTVVQTWVQACAEMSPPSVVHSATTNDS